MHLHQIAIRLSGHLNRRDVTPAGMHGVLYTVLRRHDLTLADRLHEHSTPKPYTLAPAHYDERQREMAGLVITTLTDKSAEFITSAWQRAWQEQTELRFGRIPTTVADLFILDSSSFEILDHSEPVKNTSLRFLTSTAFRQGHGDLAFPLPRNVFHRPFTVWQTFAPQAYRLPDTWLTWCENNVFVTKHNICTKPYLVNRHKRFIGFTGTATFSVRARRDADRQESLQFSSILNALTHFANFSGVGMKTTMGMGAVAVIT
ncbi:MAG: CRISPR system precrRNA processing endoribonuclease RAMP protein Cas6 [Anaerolineae bacterium]|nr:CRISPR system precrRNA processing endoribonuclease RAMP protein Cas6 [Anaerolineae bacterium]